MASDIILKACPEADIQGIRVFRIGRENTARVRPMKVVLASPNEVKSIIRRAKELKGIDAYKSIYLGFDRTPKQIEEYKKLRATLESRTLRGETNLKIKYINGFPRIVSREGDLN